MAEIKLSPEQKLGVWLQGNDVLVSAAAGSGKTFVLVERIIARLMDEENPCDIDQFLLVTYTRAAANEMKMRIAERIRQEVAHHPEHVHLQRQLTLVHKASISTVHGFCGDLVRSYFHVLGVPRSYRICDETEEALMQRDLLEQLLEQNFEAEEEDFQQFAALFTGERSDEPLFDVILRVYRESQSQVDPEGWVEEIRNSFCITPGTPLEQTRWGQVVMQQAREVLESALSSIHSAMEQIEGVAELQPRYDGFAQDEVRIQKLCQALEQGFDAAVDAFAALKFDRLPTVRGYDKEELAYLKDIRDAYKKEIEALGKERFYMKGEAWMEDLTGLSGAMDAMCRLVGEFSQACWKSRREKNLLTFSDLEHCAIRLLWEKNEEGTLVPSQAALDIRKRYIQVLVDEYQDTNAVQSAIFEAVSDGNLFMVGDVKQSIYKFRQAQPEIFIRKYLAFADSMPGNYHCDQPSRIIFRGNFRSRRQVLDVTNFIFEGIMSRSLGDIDYTDEQKLEPRASYPEQSGMDTELWMVEKEAIGAQLTEDEEENDASMEARVIATRIRQLMEHGQVYDPKTGNYRPMQYGDIAILLRSQKNRALTYEQVLENEGIPCRSEEGERYLEAVEVMVMLSLLQVIDNPRQDIPLIAVLRSSIFRFSEDHLLAIRLRQKDGLFYDAVCVAAQQGDEACARFLQKLEHYRALAREQTIDHFLWYLYEDTGYYFLVQSMENGRKRADNLKMLYEYGRKYEESSYKGLFHFVHYIRQIMETKGELAPQKTVSGGGNAVRVVTIHKSKGLEYPVCFVAGCGKRFNLQDTTGSLLLHGTLLAGPQFRDEQRGITYPTLAKQAVAMAMRREALSEEQRVLYVALTRAKEKLILVGCCPTVEKLVAKAARTARRRGPDSHALSRCSSYLEWIVAALLYHTDGGILREAAPHLDVLVRPCPSGVQLHRVDALPQSRQQGEEEQEIEQVSTQPPMTVDDWMLRFGKQEENFLHTIPSKLSVTELKGRSIDQEVQEDAPQPMLPWKEVFDTPRFVAQEQGLTPAQKGTALHTVMQFIRYECTGSLQEIEEEISRMTAMELITEQQAQACDPHKVLRFFQSPLGEQVRRAKQVWREEKFTLLLPASQLDGRWKAAGEHTTMLQGVIDCFFLDEAGQAVLLDFKTDRVRPGEQPLLQQRYGMQLEAYARAIQEIYGLSVARRYLYLFHLEQAVELLPISP